MIRPKYIPKDRRERLAAKRARRFEPEMPKDGIRREWDERMKHERWRVLVPEAWTGIRETVFARSGGKCEGCGCWIWIDTGHLHHWLGRGGGRRCDCPEHLQFLCPDSWLQDGTKRLGCHSEVHKGRLGERFERPSVTRRSRFEI